LKKVLLIILDGWGLSPLIDGNATFLAKTPNLDWIYGTYPKTSITASGIDVGLTSGESGNSEVGHLNLGSGRVVWENLPRINQSIESEEFFKNENLLKVVDHVKSGGSALHLIGLCSNGNVHSSIGHLFSLLKFADDQNLDKVYIHLISDGRDTAPRVVKEDIAKIKNQIAKFDIGKIASIIGRFYAMDRDQHFERTSKAYNLWVLGQGDKYNSTEEAIDVAYRAGADDEKIGPCLIDNSGLIRPGDGLIFFNFRADRMRQILQSFESQSFYKFQRQKVDNLFITTMTKYFDHQLSPSFFSPLDMTNVLADLVESMGLKQSHIAETEKYAHVTYFFNGGQEKPHEHESQIFVPSPRVESYDQVPAMSSVAIAEKVIDEVKKKIDFILVNFANGDMVGHTGNLAAGIKAVETIDENLGRIMSSASRIGYNVIITADHGNCENMKNSVSGEIDKEHSTNPVPLVVADLSGIPFTPQKENDFTHQSLLRYSSESPTGILADVAPTVLEILNIPKPKEMTGSDISQLI